jgi:hypothetical protein
MPRKRKRKEEPIVEKLDMGTQDTTAPPQGVDSTTSNAVETDSEGVRATMITPLTQEMGEFKKSEEPIEVDEATKFQRLCLDVTQALRSDEGKNLSCRLKVLTANKQAVVYQGMLGNVWARLKANGRHSIYRHVLNNLLKSNENTRKYFQK